MITSQKLCNSCGKVYKRFSGSECSEDQKHWDLDYMLPSDTIPIIISGENPEAKAEIAINFKLDYHYDAPDFCPKCMRKVVLAAINEEFNSLDAQDEVVPLAPTKAKE